MSRRRSARSRGEERIGSRKPACTENPTAKQPAHAEKLAQTQPAHAEKSRGDAQPAHAEKREPEAESPLARRIRRPNSPLTRRSRARTQPAHAEKCFAKMISLLTRRIPPRRRPPSPLTRETTASSICSRRTDGLVGRGRLTGREPTGGGAHTGICAVRECGDYPQYPRTASVRDN